jgi:hypothetical protein
MAMMPSPARSSGQDGPFVALEELAAVGAGAAVGPAPVGVTWAGPSGGAGGAALVAVGGWLVPAAGVAVGGTGVAVGGRGVAVGGTGVAVGRGGGVFVGGWGVFGVTSIRRVGAPC